MEPPQGWRVEDHKKQLESFVRAGITHVNIMSQRDGNVCKECIELDKADEIPIQKAIEEVILPHSKCQNEYCRCDYMPTKMSDKINLTYNIDD